MVAGSRQPVAPQRMQSQRVTAEYRDIVQEFTTTKRCIPGVSCVRTLWSEWHLRSILSEGLQASLQECFGQTRLLSYGEPPP